MEYFKKVPIALVTVLFFVFTIGFAAPASAYTNEEIVDYINNNLAGMSDAEIAAVAQSYGVSASDISNAYQDVSGVDISERAEEAFEQVVTVTVNDTNYYTTVGESANVYTAPTADTGGTNLVGTFDINTGIFTNVNNATVDITTLSNVTGSVSNEGGVVTTQISGQDWNTVVGDTEAGLTYLSCTASGGTGCLAAYNSANVRNTTLAAKAGKVCTPGTTYTVNCSDYAGMYGIPRTNTVGTATYSINSCKIPTFNISGCSAPVPAITSFTASPTGLPFGGGPVTLEWTSINTTSCVAWGGGWSGERATSDRETIVVSKATATFKLTCSGPGGTTSR